MARTTTSSPPFLYHPTKVTAICVRVQIHKDMRNEEDVTVIRFCEEKTQMMNGWKFTTSQKMEFYFKESGAGVAKAKDLVALNRFF